MAFSKCKLAEAKKKERKGKPDMCVCVGKSRAVLWAWLGYDIILKINVTLTEVKTAQNSLRKPLFALPVDLQLLNRYI